MTKLFLFAYPQEIFFNIPFRWPDEKIESLNDAIETRYRSQGWQVGFLTYDNWSIDARIKVSEKDLRITDGQTVYDDKKAGVIRRTSDNQPAWPNPAVIIDKFPKISQLNVGGFHEGSCTDIIAKEAYGRGINTLVDEELTNLFLAYKPGELQVTGQFPQADRCKGFRDDLLMEYFLERRAGKPWLYDWSTYVAPKRSRKVLA